MPMILRTYIPQLPLASFVDQFWYLEGYAPVHGRELTLPDGSVEVLIDLSGEAMRFSDRENRAMTFGNSVLCGAHSNFFVIDTRAASASAVIGIHFKPGGVSPFLHVPVDELLNAHVSLDCLWGASAGELRDELLACGTVDEKFRVLERRLLSLAVRPLTQHPAVHFALTAMHRAPSTAVIADIVRQSGMSHRRFNQVFSEEVGLTPKRLHRIFRFQEVLRLIGSGRSIEWADVATACGYYDQPHFAKDFKAFSGISPGDYRTIAGRHQNHVALRT